MGSLQLKMTTSTLLLPSSPSLPSKPKSVSTFHFEPPLSIPLRPLSLSLSPHRLPFSNLLSPSSLRPNHKHLTFTPPRSLPNSQSPDSQTLNPFPFLASLDLSQITPFTIAKWSLILSLSLFAAKKTLSTLLNPFFWLYFSWTWLFWPWILAVALAIYGLYSFYKHSLGQSTVGEQLAIVTSTITWLTLVPPAHFNGFLEGWPIALFFIYHYFFFFESTVRKRLYGDLYPRAHDPKWDITLPKPFQLGFSVSVLIGHWLAAFEGPELHLIPGGWWNLPIWGLVLVAVFTRYHSVLYLSKYSENVVVPTAVVQFGPYRWVRHPMYAANMMLFALYCVALRAPMSLAFLVVVCLVYYGRKAEAEEVVMVETFGERYVEYMDKVRYRLIPLLY